MPTHIRTQKMKMAQYKECFSTKQTVQISIINFLWSTAKKSGALKSSKPQKKQTSNYHFITVKILISIF